MCMSVCDCVRVCVCVCDSIHESVWSGGADRERKGQKMGVQERLFIYVVIYLNKVHFLNLAVF